MDREKIINAYECVITRGKSVCECGKCDYHINNSAVFFCDNQRVLTDVLSLLKEQEAVKPSWSRGKPFCGACGLRIHGGKFCNECGKPILWEGR